MTKDFSNVIRPDHVICNNCMADMYVDYDTCTCPVCGTCGSLMDIEQEVEL